MSYIWLSSVLAALSLKATLLWHSSRAPAQGSALREAPHRGHCNTTIANACFMDETSDTLVVQLEVELWSRKLRRHLKFMSFKLIFEVHRKCLGEPWSKLELCCVDCLDDGDVELFSIHSPGPRGAPGSVPKLRLQSWKKASCRLLSGHSCSGSKSRLSSLSFTGPHGFRLP